MHSETTPYFLLQANNWLETIDDGSSNFVDTGSGTDGQNHYHKLLLEACDQSYTVHTGEIGKFSFNLVPANKKTKKEAHFQQ